MNEIQPGSERPKAERKRPFHQFDLNLLRALDVLLEERNVTHAATRMNVSQPAMSGALQRMRDFFGDQLLIRVGREMELTPLAQSLAGQVRATLNNIRRTLDADPHFDPATTKRNFTIAMSDYVVFVMMPAILRQLSIRAPYISCSAEPINEASFARLSSNDIELCIASDHWRGYGDYGPGPDIRSELMFEDQFVCVVDQNSPISTLSPDAYRTMQHVVVRMGRGIMSVVELSWLSNDLDISVTGATTSFASAPAMVRGTPLVATVQSRLARALAPALGVREVPCPVPIPPLRESLVWHARNDFEPGHQFMREIITAAARSLPSLDELPRP